MAEKSKSGSAKAKPAPKKKLQVKKSTVKDLTRDTNVKGGAPSPGVTDYCRKAGG